jgi:hypothetical protein
MVHRAFQCEIQYSKTVKKGVEAAFTLWLVVVTIRYAQSVLSSLAVPFTPGKDVEWFALWLFTAVVVVCLSIWSGVYRIFSSMALLAIVTISIFSGTLLSALLASWFVVVAYAWGRWLLRAAGVAPEGFIESVAIAVPQRRVD